MLKALGIVAVLGGCRGGGGSDTCTVDCGADAGLDAPISGTIEVIALDDHGVPAIGLRVIATFAGGDDEAVTGNDGRATVAATGPTDVTVVRTTGLGTALTTIRAAAPGETLTFGHRRNDTPSVQRTLTWPTDPKAFRYQVQVSCGGVFAIVNAQAGVQQQSVALTLDPSCANDFDATVSYFTQFTTERGFLLALGNVGDVTFTGSFAQIAEEPANFAQLPADVALGNMRFTGRTVFRAADPAFGQGAFGIVTGNTSGANSLLALPSAGSAGRELAFGVSHDADTKRVQQIVDRVPPTGQYNLGVEPALLPWMTSAPVVDLSAKTITWTELPSGALARTHGDLIAAEINYSRGASVFRWRIIAPPTEQATLGIPELPGDEVFEPLGSDTLGTTAVRSYAFGAGVDHAVLRPRADLAISMEVDLFVPVDSFLASGATSAALSRMTVSFYAP